MKSKQRIRLGGFISPEDVVRRVRNSNIPLRSMIYAGNKSRLTLRAIQQGEDKLYLDKRFRKFERTKAEKKARKKVKNILLYDLEGA